MPVVSMELFTLALSRLVPLLFLASAILIAARFLSDKVRSFAPRAAGVVLWGTVVIGVFSAVGYGQTSWSLVRAYSSFEQQRWDEASDYFERYLARTGRLGPRVAHRYAVALFDQRRFRKASQLLESFLDFDGATIRGRLSVVRLFAMSRFYMGDLRTAERGCQAVLQSTPQDYQCAYFLGRIAERNGNVIRALERYQSTLRIQPEFYPALYHAVRLCWISGDETTRRSVLAQGHLSAPPPELADAGSPPPAKEFFLVLQD